ncbi:hypothetical protein C8J56DRAFT_990660 [Mycena floridula]|nr:hypothetical protein C8J56DRAFT_990660 [Mycena floridula]
MFVKLEPTNHLVNMIWPLMPSFEAFQLFIDLLTEGFSEDESTFKTFVLDILINDKKSSARLKGLKGARARRIDAHLAKWN